MTIVIDDGHDVALEDCNAVVNCAVILELTRRPTCEAEETQHSIATE